jgi:hypothetical protein
MTGEVKTREGTMVQDEAPQDDRREYMGRDEAEAQGQNEAF